MKARPNAMDDHAATAKPKPVKHPERICWGCDNYCPADDLQCGSRTRHPVELCGEDWQEWSDRLAAAERTDPGK